MISEGERSLVTQLRYVSAPSPVLEHRFDPKRRWRFDLAWPDRKLAVEVEGGTWVAGRHTTGAGFLADIEKYNAAVLAGWRVLRVTTGMVDDGRAVALVEAALGPWLHPGEPGYPYSEVLPEEVRGG
jgi:hypothetical protein